MSSLYCPHKAIAHSFSKALPGAAQRRIIWVLGQSYPLKLDSRRGHNLWQGCFTFSDIICDGDLNSLSPKRDGLLKMGGTYWYYVGGPTLTEARALTHNSTRSMGTRNAMILPNCRRPSVLFYPANASTYSRCPSTPSRLPNSLATQTIGI
jgi:hypothetical protein